MPLLDREISGKLGMLQSLDDAIAFRSGRLEQPCQGCQPGGRCTEHAYDEHLIEQYQARHAAAFSDACKGIDPGEIERMIEAGGGVPPTAGLLSAAIITRLRELAADGPALTVLDSRPVLIELEDGVVVEYPLTSSNST